MADVMDDIVAEFVAEAEESLGRVEPLFVDLESKGYDREILNDVFRRFHTLKGAAGFLGFRPVVAVAHGAEGLLKRLRDAEVAPTCAFTDAVLAAVDVLGRLAGRIRRREPLEDEDVAPVLARLDAALAAVPDARGAAAPADPAPTSPADPPGAAPAAGAPKAAPPLRVDVARVDKVMDLAGEIVLVRNRLLNLAGGIAGRHADDPAAGPLQETVAFLDRVTSDMQVAVLKIRMQPIGKVFARFPRLVRDLSAGLGKEIDLRIEGADTEVDKSVIEQIGDPIVHILRNAIDHGLETPAERRALGKTTRGSLRIAASQQGSQIAVEVSDDGRGIDLDRVRAKAVERGLVSREESERMSDEAATNLIFLPGFSTAQRQTELSGRGVGMDVVRTNVARLNGYVDVRTAKGEGTAFRILIPLTVAIIRVLMVRSAGATYAVPLSLVEEILGLAPGQGHEVAGRRVLVIRDRIHPLIELPELLGGRPAPPAAKRYAVLVAVGETRFCVAVDGLAGEEEAVIKSVEGVDGESARVIGATITGDGRVVFVLDFAGIARSLLAAGGGGEGERAACGTA